MAGRGAFTLKIAGAMGIASYVVRLVSNSRATQQKQSQL